MLQHELPELCPPFPVWNAVDSDSLWAKAQALNTEAQAIVGQCEQENRDLEPAEAERLDKIFAEFRRTEALIAQSEFLSPHRPSDSGVPSLGRKSTPQGPGGSSYSPRTDGGTIVGETDRGQVIKAYKPSEQIAEWQGARSEVSFQQWIRAAFSGDWGNMPRNAMSERQGSEGGFLAPPALAAEVIELMRNRAQVVNAGALTIPMTTSDLSFARQTGDPTAAWRGELGSITASQATLDLVTFHARSLAAIVVVSEELLMDAPNAGSLIQSSLAAALALALDKSALVGSGVAQPMGIINAADVQALSAVGAITNYVPFARAIAKLWALNYQPTALIYNGKTAGKLDELTNIEEVPMQPPPSWATYQHLISNQLEESSNTSTAVMGDFSKYWFAVRQQLVIDIERTGTVGSTNLLTDLGVAIRAWMRVDGMPVQPSAFCLLPGIITTP